MTSPEALLDYGEMIQRAMPRLLSVLLVRKVITEQEFVEILGFESAEQAALGLAQLTRRVEG